jgi:branched-chain amino acid transport system ATP-binding protein
MLELEGINVSYGDLQALWDVDLTVEEGEIVALIGSNGAGKSTLLKTIAGGLRPKTGSVIFDGIRLDMLPSHEIVRVGVALVPEGRRLFPEMTVLENLEMGAFVERARRLKKESLGRMFELFPILQNRLKQPAGTLSGGEQQMLAIARALMSRPRLLMLDEMSLGLAPIAVKSIYDTLIRIRRTTKITILVVEQNVRYALEVADRGYIIENGRVVGHGNATDLTNSDDVKRAYLAVG